MHSSSPTPPTLSLWRGTRAGLVFSLRIILEKDYSGPVFKEPAPSEFQLPQTSLQIPDRVDVLIVGAGPAGLAAGRRIVDAGATVLIVDARARIGNPPRCGELARDNFMEVFGFDPEPDWVRWRIAELGNMPVLNRSATESGAARILSRRGASVAEGCALMGLGEYDGVGRTARLRSSHGSMEVYARLVIAADGAPSRVARLAGIDTLISPLETVSCLAYRIIDTTLENANNIRFEFPPVLNPHYFWVIPSGPSEANVGLGVPAHRGHAARPLLDRLMDETGALTGGKRIQTIVGWYPSTLPLETPFVDGLLVTGTAARLIDAELGEGLWQAAFSGAAAGETYVDVGERGTSAQELASYRDRVDRLYGPLRHGYAKRRKREARSG